MRAAARSVASKAARSFARGAPACSSGATRTAATAAAISASSAAGAWSKASAGVAATLGAGLILATPLLQPTECSATPMHGKPGTAGERTFLMVKPEGVARGLVSEIIGRWEKRGYTLVGIKVLQPDAKLAGEHYADLSARPFFKDLVHYMSSSGPVVAMVWQGKDVIKVSRDMIGMTNPLTSAPGTVRGDLAVNIGRNVIHGSDGVEGAETEIPLWFQPHELVNIDSTKWPQHVGLYLYDTKQA